MKIDYFHLSDLTDIKKQHLAWRLDNKTGCGLLTAAAVSRGNYGDLALVEIFRKFGGCSDASAKINAVKVMKFRLHEAKD